MSGSAHARGGGDKAGPISGLHVKRTLARSLNLLLALPLPLPLPLNRNPIPAQDTQ